MFSFNQLPVEILYGIFYHLDIPDILRMRRVSRYLNQVSHNKVVWSDAFRKAEFVRPPGPFLSQSAHDLENTVVSGFRVDRNLRHGGGTAQEERPTIKLREIRYTGVEVRICLIFGRFLFIASNLLHQFEHDVFTIDAVDLGPRVIVIQGRVGSGSDDDTERRLVALDVHTRTQFLLSSFTHVPFETDDILLTEVAAFEGISSISTSTHLILARSSWTPAAGWSSFFEAFALPPPDPHRRFTSTSTPLSPSHRGTIPRLDVSETVLLNDSILDPTTQDILVAIRVHAFEPSHPLSPKHGVLRLSGAPTSDAHDHEVGNITFQLLGPLGHSRVPFPHPSFNGTGRVFYTREPGPYGIVSALEYDLHASRGDEEAQSATVVEYPSILRFPPHARSWTMIPIPAGFASDRA
ncbi:hypothetical protein OG21DRAFT_1483087 [Imleria badia]|nr:hypothetical protein OG21DRAFT_1483087 [Imleria badia]